MEWIRRIQGSDSKENELREKLAEKEKSIEQLEAVSSKYRRHCIYLLALVKFSGKVHFPRPSNSRRRIIEENHQARRIR